MTAPASTDSRDRKSALHSRKRILVVDDEPSVRDMLALVLASEGYRVSTAASGEEALHRIKAARLDLVLLDLNMPGLDGWETLEKLAADCPSLPVIIITARPNQRFTALAAGVVALLEKPLDFTEFLRTIEALWEETARPRPGGAASPFHLPGGLEDPIP